MDPKQGTPANNPFAPPLADVADVAAPGSGPVLASRGSRFLAALVDVALQLAVMLGVGALLGMAMFDDTAGFGTEVLINLLSMAAFVAMHGVLLVRHGQTWGKRWLGLRIVRSDGSRASAGRVLGLRYGIGFVLAPVPGLGVVFGLLDALLIFRASHQCLHDTIADTIVVRA